MTTTTRGHRRQTMTYNLTLTFTVKDLDNSDEAYDFATSLAEHVLDTFNDNDTINPLVQIEAIQEITNV